MFGNAKERIETPQSLLSLARFALFKKIFFFAVVCRIQRCWGLFLPLLSSSTFDDAQEPYMMPRLINPVSLMQGKHSISCTVSPFKKVSF